MSLQPAPPISIITCQTCHGQGCQACNKHGVYAIKDDQTIVFGLPDFIDIKTRRLLKKTALLKKLFLIITAVIIITLSWSLL